MLVLADEELLLEYVRRLDAGLATTYEKSVEKLKATYTAIGEYVVEFSQLEMTMRALMAKHLANSDQQVREVTVAISPMTFNQVTNSYFALCRGACDLDEAECEIESKLRRKVIDAGNQRNDFLHGVWFTHFNFDPELRPSRLMRIKPERMAGAVRDDDFPPERIAELAAGVSHLREKVAYLGEFCLGTDLFVRRNGRRLRDVMTVEDGEVAFSLDGTASPPEAR